MALVTPIYAMAAPQDDVGTLTIKSPQGQADYAIYKVADFSEFGEFDVVEPFDKYMYELDGLSDLENNTENSTVDTWIDLSVALEAIVTADQIPYTLIERTNDRGVVTIENMEKGLYLVLGEPVEMEGRFYNSLPGLVTLPNRDVNGNWTNHATVDFSEKLSLICEEYKVMKVWKDEGYEKKRPEKIEVVLYVDGEEFDTITLNEDNNWEYAWENIPKGAKVTLAEKNVPNGYKVAYKNNNGYIVIENKYVPDKPEDPENPAPQTGQLWWPVPFLAIFGIAFFTIGWLRRNSEER